mmetsp:Transcript_105123/g.279756  ORF Transcript_105123/g.279756 Transcript_105123/m.279756 type:complete len:205 (+) Transcript_105123:429-1043(+)
MVPEAGHRSPLRSLPNPGLPEGALHHHVVDHRHWLLHRHWRRLLHQHSHRVLRHHAHGLQRAGLRLRPPHRGAVLGAPEREAEARAGPRQLRLARADPDEPRGLPHHRAAAEHRGSALGLPYLRRPRRRGAVADESKLSRRAVPDSQGVRRDEGVVPLGLGSLCARHCGARWGDCADHMWPHHPQQVGTPDYRAPLLGTRSRVH